MVENTETLIMLFRSFISVQSVQLAMIRKARWALMAAVGLACLACALGSPLDGETTSDEGDLNKMLLREEVERQPPANPPVVQMVFDTPDGEMAVDGLLSVRNWNIPPNPHVVYPWDGPHPWPATTPRKSAARKVRMLTESPPTFVTISAYDEPPPEGESNSSVDYDCVLSGGDRCIKVTSDGAVELDEIPPDIMRHTDFVVFAVWNTREVEVEANWAFSFTDE